MIPEDANNPFKPGLGTIPPAFPGREEEQYLLKENVSRLKQNICPSCDIVICAPRGNGKTALLNWVEQEITSDSANNIDVIHTRQSLKKPNSPTGKTFNLLNRRSSTKAI